MLVLLLATGCAGGVDRPRDRRHRQGGDAARARERGRGPRRSTGSSTARRPPTAARRPTGRGHRHRHAQRVRARDRAHPGHALPLPRLRLELQGLGLRGGPDVPHRLARPAAGLPGDGADHGADRADEGPLLPDGRVFVAEKSGFIKVYDSLADTTPTLFADLSTKVHNFWDRGLLGMALDPDFPAKPFVYVSTPTTPRSAARRPRWGDMCPDPPGRDRRRLRGQRPPVAARGRRQRDGRTRAGADRGLVPAVPQPLDRRHRVRRRRRALRERRRRRQLQLRRLRPERAARRTRATTRRCPWAARRPRRRPRAARCARRTCARGRPTTPRRHPDPGRPGHRRGRCPTTRSTAAPTSTHGGSSPTAPQPVPVHDPAGHR